MADARRWSVTYTKHVKRKRKVYQDGFLELRASTNELLLYDDCEKLLECRILKRDEIVSCGEAVTFNAFLVEVDSAEGHHEPLPASDSLGRGTRTEKNKPRKLNLSPSHQIIRDFKKREILKYEVMQSKSPDATKSSVTVEWEVLYTTQITQKAKKYHDGFLQLSVRGSIGRQVTLFDASRNSIGGRFLKKDEKIESGGTMAFDGHLVEIGEPRGDYKSLGENNCDVTRGEKGVMQEHKNYANRNNNHQKTFIKTEVQENGASHCCQDTTESSATEWQVLYTTQLTQKSKKYHDGFLQLAISGSRGTQAMLCDATKTILHSRFLRKGEVIRTGVSLKFDAYLIDIGEPEGNNDTDLTARGNTCSVVKETEKIHSQQNSITSDHYALKGKSLTNACLMKDAKSKFSISKIETKESSRRDPMNKCLRDARQILSILQKPRTENCIAAGYTDKTTPTKGPIVSNAVDLASHKDDQPQLSEIVDAMESRENFAATSSGSTSQLMKDTDNGNANQKPCSDIDAGTRCHDGAKASNMASATASCNPVDDAKNPSEDPRPAREMDEFPSFDLRF